MKHQFLLAGLMACAPLIALSAQPSEPNVQQRFDAASEALAAQRWEEALAQFEALETRLRNNVRSLAVVRVRKAVALSGLGRRAEAEQAVRLGLADLPADDASLNEDRFSGLRMLGEMEELRLDYETARQHLRAAEGVDVPPRIKLTVYRALIQVQMFDAPEAALADADEAIALAAQAGLGREETGLLHSFRGRVLLNMHRYDEARDALRTALESLGGLTLRVGLSDIVARSDLAIATLLAGRPNDARRYLAYTGAGRFETDLAPGRGRLAPPDCGDGLRPEDVAVVEYSIRDDGSVSRATPIYASRGGDVAVRMARAVLDWSWEPEAFGEMPPLLRAAIRVELRCKWTGTGEGDRSTPDEETARWAAGHGATWPETFATGRPVAALREALTRLDQAPQPNPVERLRLMIELGFHQGVGYAETADIARRAMAIAVETDAPPSIVTPLALLRVEAEQNLAGRARPRQPIDLGPALELPEVRADPRVLARVQLAQAGNLYYAERFEPARAAIDRLLATPGLEARVRAGALQLRSLLAAREGDREAARAAFVEAGPEALPCRYLPMLRNTGASSSDFPNEAMSWGFEGWAQTETFILADGSSTAPRTVMAYPPFVFGEAAQRVAAGRRFNPYHLPDGARCPTRVTIHFRIAGPGSGR